MQTRSALSTRAAPLCSQCDDRGALDAEADGERVCTDCPRCALCDERLADTPARAIVLDGWDAWCTSACLQDDTEAWSPPARGALALALLEACADAALAEHPDRSELLGWCQTELASLVRALVVRPRVSERAPRASARWSASELALLAGASSVASVVERRCPGCQDTAERFVDPLPTSDAREELALCDWHSHLEALRIEQRRRPALSVRPSARKRPASA